MNIYELIAERDGLAAAVERIGRGGRDTRFHRAELRDLNKMIDRMNTVDTECEVVETKPLRRSDEELWNDFKESIRQARH